MPLGSLAPGSLPGEGHRQANSLSVACSNNYRLVAVTGGGEAMSRSHQEEQSFHSQQTLEVLARRRSSSTHAKKPFQAQASTAVNNSGLSLPE